MAQMQFPVFVWEDEARDWVDRDADWTTFVKNVLKYQWQWSMEFAWFGLHQMWLVVLVACVWRRWTRQPLETMEQYGDMIVQAMMMKFGVGFLQLLQKLQKLYKSTQTCAEKCFYMEKRMMQMQEWESEHPRPRRSMVQDILRRSMEEDILKYDAFPGAKQMLDQRLRIHFEDFFGANVAVQAGFWTLWSMMCSEVLLRKCRDLLVERQELVNTPNVSTAYMYFAMEQKVKDQKKTLDNLQMKRVKFWSPMDGDVLELENLAAWVGRSGLEFSMLSQLIDRKVEIMQIIKEVCAKGPFLKGVSPMEFFVAGMPEIAKKWKDKVLIDLAGASSSSHDAMEVTKEEKVEKMKVVNQKLKK